MQMADLCREKNFCVQLKSQQARIPQDILGYTTVDENCPAPSLLVFKQR